MSNLFKKELHYQWTTFGMVFCIVFFMKYFFPHEWAESPSARAFVDAVAGVVPVLYQFKLHPLVYRCRSIER
jgi:hypothetical protein